MYSAEQSNNYNVRYIPLDLGDTNSIREFASVIYSSEERLDILINNAGKTKYPGVGYFRVA